jgi:uncharacterized membrane protein
MEIIKSLFNVPIVFKLHTLHPLLVHFPIGLLFTAFLFYIYARIKSSKTAEFVALLNLMTGTLLSFAAAYSGVIADERLNLTREVNQLMEIHEKLGWIVAGFFTILSIWGFFSYRHAGGKVIPLFLLFYLFGAVALGFQGYLGGLMVYEGGAGVKERSPVVQPEGQKGAAASDSHKKNP